MKRPVFSRRAFVRGALANAATAAMVMMAPMGGALLAGCESKPVFNSLDITGATGFGTDFHLVDQNGRPRSMADFRGKAVVMFFGFTRCPDVCPTTLSDLRKAIQLLGPDAERVQVLFITVDPARDTQEVLAAYIASFHPSFLALRGDEEATRRVARDFKIMYNVQPGKTAATYTVDHTAAALAFDPQGRLRLFINYELGADKIAPDLKLILKGN